MTQKLSKQNVLYVLHRAQERCHIPLRVETENGYYTRTANLIDDMLAQVKHFKYDASFTHEFTGGQLVVHVTLRVVVNEEWRESHMDALRLIAQEHHDQGFNRVDEHDRIHLELAMDEFNAELERAQEKQFKHDWPEYKRALIKRLVLAFEDEGVTAPLLRKCVRFTTNVLPSSTFMLDEFLTLDDLP